MEPEDLPWPGELEEEEEEEEEAEESANQEEDEVVEVVEVVEEVEEGEGRELDSDFNYESQPRESTDDEDDEEAKAWLQAHPSGSLLSSSRPSHRFLEDERTGPEKVVPLTCHVWQQSLYQDNSGIQISDANVVSVKKTAQWDSGDDQRTESWHCLPQEMDSSHTLDTTHTSFNMREERTEVTGFPSLEEGILTQPENQVKEPKRDLLCSPLLVIQDNFASPDLPLLTCLTQDQELGSDSLFQQSELDFAPLRGIPGKSEDTEWFSRPSEVSEAVFQAASEVASDLVNSCISVSQHSLLGSAAVGSQRSFLPPEEGTKEETVSSDTDDELQTSEDFDSCDALCSYVAWKTQEVQEPEASLADEGQVSVSASSDTSDEYMTSKQSDSFDDSYSYVQYRKQKALQQSGKYLTSKDHDSYSDSSDTIDKNKIPEGSDNFSAPFSCMPWNKQETSHHPETYVISKDRVSFPHEVAPRFNNKMSHSVLCCLLERRGEGIPLTASSHFFDSVYLKAPAENEVKDMIDSLEGCERNEEGQGKELSQGFELKESRRTLVFSEVHPRSSEIQSIESVVVPDNSIQVSEIHIHCRGPGTSKMEVSGGPLQTLKSNLDETSEQLYFQGERDQKATSAFSGKSVDASENVAFEAVIASIEPSKKESTVNEIQTDINKSLINNSQESESKNPYLSLLNYNDESSFFDKLSHPCYESTPRVFELAASKPLLLKKDNGDSSFYWHPNLKSLPSAPQEMFIKPLSLIPEWKSSASLCEKSHSQAVGLGKAQSALFQCDIGNEPFLPIGKIESVPVLDLTEKVGSSNIFYPLKVWTSDSLVLQDLKQQTLEEVADPSNYILGKNINSSNIIESPSAGWTVGSSFSANLVTCDAKSQGTLPVTSNASLVAVGQETLLKAGVGQGKIPRPMGAKSSFTIHTIMQNDSCFLEGLQVKAESDICTLDDDTESCNLDENAVVRSTRVADLQREVCDQGDLTGEYIELAGLKNVLDDLEVCDSFLHWQSALQLSSKQESDFQELVDHSNTGINQSFSSVLPPFVPHELTKELEYHYSDLRMLRVSPDTVQKTLKHLAGDTSKGGTAEVTQSTLKPGIRDSDIGSHLSLFPEDFPQLALRFPQETIIGPHTDILSQQALDSHTTEKTPKVSTVHELADQKTGISTVPSSSYSQRGKPGIFCLQYLPDRHLTEEAPKVLAVPGPADQKTGIPTVFPSSYPLGEKHSIFYSQALPDSYVTEEALKVSAVPVSTDQRTEKITVPSTSYLQREKHVNFSQQQSSDSHLTEQALKVSVVSGPAGENTGIPILPSISSSLGEKPSVFYQQALPDSHLLEQARKVSAVPGPVDQKTRIPAASSTYYSYGERPQIFYQQTLPESHLPEQALKFSAAPGSNEQKTGIPTLTSASYSHREKPNIFCQQELPDSSLTEQAQKVSPVTGSAEQKTGIPTLTSASYSLGEKPSLFYQQGSERQQELPDNPLTEQAQKVLAIPGPDDQNTGISIGSSRPYSPGEQPNIFSQQVLPDSHLTEETLKASSAPRPGDAKTGVPTVPSSSYSPREKSGIFYQQVLPGCHLSEEALKVSVATVPAEIKSGLPSEASNFYTEREKTSIFYQQELPDSHLTEQAQKVSPVTGSAEQKTGIPTLTSASYSHREKPNLFCQQELPDSSLTEQAQKVSPVPGPAEQKTGIPTLTSASYSHREKPNLFCQQELPDSSLTEQAQKVSPVLGPAEQKTGIPTLTSTSYSLGEKPSLFYQQGSERQQELPDNPLTEQAQKVLAIPGPDDQNTGISIGSSRPYSLGEQPNIFSQQVLPDSHLTEETLKASSAPRPGDAKTGVPTVPSSSYSPREKSGIFYQQVLPGCHLSEEALKVSVATVPAEIKSGLPSEASNIYTEREKTSIFYQQELPDSHLTEQAQKVSPVPGPADQKTEISTVTSASYSHIEKPFIFYPQDLPDSHLSQESLKVTAVSEPVDKKTGIPVVPSTSYSQREKPIIFYPQAIPDIHLTEEALKVSAISGSADWKTGIPTVSSVSSSHTEEPVSFSLQALAGSLLLEEALKVSVLPGPADQKAGLSSEPPSSYSHGKKPIIFYPQGLTDSQVPQETLEVSAVPGPAAQKTGLPSEPSSCYSHKEKPIIFCLQGLTDSQVPQEALKVSTVPGRADQKTGLPSELSSSYSHREKPIIFSSQGLTDSQIPQEALKVSAVPGRADQKTGLPSESSSPYSHREKPIIFYSQGLTGSQVPLEALKASAVPGPADQKTGLPSEPSSSYSHREKPIIFYPQDLTDSQVPQEALKVSAVPGPADQKTALPSEPSSSYSLGGKPIIFYQQALSDRHLTEEAVNISASPGPADQETGVSTVPSISYSHIEKPSVLYQQPLSDSQLAVEALKVSAVSGPGDQKTRKPTVTSTSYSHREKEKPIISYQQELPDLTQEALKVLKVPGLGGQKTGIPAVTSTFYSHREKPIISYHQELSDPNEGALRVLGTPGPADQKTGIQIGPSTSYSHRESPIFSYQKESSDITEETWKVSPVSGPANQKTEIHIIPSSSYSYREKDSILYQQELPDVTEKVLKVFALPGPADQKTEIPTGPSSSYSHKEKLKISPVILPDVQKTEFLTAPPSSYSKREKPKISTVSGPDDQKTLLPTVFHNSCSQNFEIEDILKISPVPEPIVVNSGIPIPLSSSSSHREKSNIFYPQELPDKHLAEDALNVSSIPVPADQKSLLPTAPPRSFSHREKPNIFYQQDFPDRLLPEDSVMFSRGLGQADQITGLSTVTPGTYSHSEKQKLVSDHVQMLIDNLDSPNSSIISSSMPLSSQADGRVIISKPESSGFEDVGSVEIQDTSNSSKTLKEIRTLLMEAENIALKRCNFPAPLVPFRDVSDISIIQSKKMVCFKEPLTAAESNSDLPRRQPFTEESPSNKCIQKDISTQTNLKCQRGIENWEFISSTTLRSPLQEAESKAGVTLDETLRQYRAAQSVMRSEPEGYSGTIGNKIVIPMMTIIKSDSSSDASSCSWDSNSLESVSDVLLNFFPCASTKTSLTDSREEESVSESDDCGGSNVDSLAAHVKNLLKCESSLNHAKQILRNAEEEECRVRARAWNLKFNLAHECGYSISELNEADRKKVEEIKAELFSHGRTADLSKGLPSPQGIRCNPEAVCGHIIIESHEKGCFRTAKQPQLDSHPYVFRPADPSDVIRGQRSPSSWKTRHINLSKSLDQSNPHFKVWNSLQLRSPSPFQNFTADDFRISHGLRMPFHEKIDPWLSELVEPVPPEEMDCHSSSHMLPPEPMKKFTTSITFASHRHSKCFSDSSVLKVGVTEGSQCTGASVGVFNSHFTEEQNPPRDLEQKTSSPSSFKIVSHSPDTAVTILAESSRQSQKLSIEHSQQEEKLLERSDFKGSDSEPSTSAKYNSVKEVHFSDNHTLISVSRPSSTLGVKEKTVAITPNLSSHVLLERQELFEQSKAPHTDHHVRKYHSPPPQHQDYVAPNLPCRIFLEKRELFEQSKAPHLDHQMRENQSPFPQGQDYIASDLPSSIFLEQRQLFEQSKAPDVDHMGKCHSPFPQGQDYVVEKNNQHKFKSYISNMINVEAKFDSVVSQPVPNQRTLVTSASTPPSNRKALSCVRITLYPKTPSKVDSGTLDKRLHSLDPASKTRMNSEFNSDLQTISSRSLEPTSKLLASKPVAQNQESLGFLGLKSSPDFQVVQSPLPDSNTISQDLKTIPFQNSQIVTSRQTQVNISDLEGYSSPEGIPVSADRPSEEIKTPFSAFSGKLSSDAVTQITTESPGKTMFSSEIFINAKDHGFESPEPSTQNLDKVPVKFVSSSSVQQITHPHGTDAQPSLLPYKPPGSTRMYYVPQLKQIPSYLDSRSDTTIESSHSGSNDAIAPDFPAEVLGTRDDDLSIPADTKHKEGIYSKRAVAKPSFSVGKNPPQKDNADAEVQVSVSGDESLSDKNQKKEIYSKKAVAKAAQPEEKEFLETATAGSSGAAAAEPSARLQNIKIESPPDTEAIKQNEEIHSKRTVPKEAWTEDQESLQIDISESRCHSEFENTTHSVFRSAKFYFHHPVHLPTDQDVCHESLGRSVFMRHSWKDFFQRHPDKQREHTCLPCPDENVEKTKADYTRIESLSINVNLENKEVMHSAKSQARDYPKSDKQISDPKRDRKVTPELTTQHTVSLNELWNKYQERQKQKKPPEFSDRKELSLVERLDRLAKLLQNPITYSLWASESTQDDSRGERDIKQQQKIKLQKKKRYKTLEKCHKNTGELKKSKALSTHQAGKSNQIKIEQIKFDKYILRKQPGFHYINNTSSDSRPSDESELLTDTATNILSTTNSPVESDILTQTDKEVTLQERSSSISTIDTARLIQAFGHERVCLSPRRIKLYSSITDHQRRYLERRSKKNKKALNTSHPQMTSEHTRRKHIQVANHVISSDSISSSTSSFWSSSPTLCNKQNVHMLNKGVQAGNLEIVNGVKKHTRDVGMTFPTPSSSEARVEEYSDVTSWSEEKIEEKSLLTGYLGDKKLRKNKQSCSEGVSWFVPVENVKCGPKKENLPKLYGPGICWFAPITNTKPWREPLREQNWQGQHMDSHGSLAGPGRDPPRPFVKATLQESLQLHRPDFISRSGERIKRLKLIVQERKLQNMLQSEREALFNTVREWQGCQDPTRRLLKRGFLDAQKNRPIGKKEMIQRSKRIYEQLPEVQRKREEEKRRLEYKSYRLRAQLFKKKVTNQLLGRKVPWN
ncbi:Alstrom syndrome protein 1 isoform X2 [Leopardus geoffroyi]|uniref:Alstrom syndrome protein 1 isoform X2 n=1 Tax=Leopardus geoffroyi TaxID=46844 RepID=UPI001E262480|nr:Alstrom syndrome protein 1 isoform X2 [Leopardus geoffroyi]